ncbi:carbohydrate-binding module family 21 protein [Piromyces sp. E2]|nr:carbohydrate-binding module family 21 protein [Piromyces sp. E2]|eukprot:OUM62517.1 carbohydrate-binding module family 21 protein [Piromyces sp. E2]
MFFNNFTKAKNIILSNSQSYDNSYDDSLDNSYVDHLDLFNIESSLNSPIKNQVEKTIGTNENLRRKDSAIELEDMKNSFSDSENHSLEKSEIKKLSHGDNKKVEFIVDGDSSEEEGDEINHQDEGIFSLEMDPINNQSPISKTNQSPSQNLSSNPRFIHNPNQYYSVNNKNHIMSQSPLKSLIRNTLNLTSPPNKNSNQCQKLSFQKIITHHITESPKKVEKIRFSNTNNELKNSPTKYNGLDILKPILKKRYTQTSSLGKAIANTKDLVYTQTSSLKAQKPRPQKKKSVHFKSENEECPFKKFECPSNIVNLPIYIVDSRLEPFLEAKLIKLKGFPSKRKVQLPWDRNVILESVGLIDDETQEHDILRLTIQVRNLAFEKKVKVHLTFDDWENKEVKEAKYRSTEKNDCNQSIDKFILDVDTDCDGESVCNLQFAIQYLVDHQEFWDNNNNNNYSLKVDRTVRIPAKEIKSHPYCEGPVVRYKLKPGYHYPLFKSNLKEHPSADVPKDAVEVTNSGDHFTNSYSKPSSKEITGAKATASDVSAPKVTRFSVERNTIEKLMAPSSSPDSEDDVVGNSIADWHEEETNEDVSNKEFFSWNEPIILRKPNTQDKSQKQFMGRSSELVSSSSSPSSTISSYTLQKDTVKREGQSSPSTTTSFSSSSSPAFSNWNTDSPSRTSHENSFHLPKHENWFKEAPSCIPFGSSPRKLYHHPSNLKWFNRSSSPSSSPSPYEGKSLSEKEREEEEEHNKRLNSKYAAFSTHLASSSSRYMRNNLYGCSNDQSMYHVYSQPPVITSSISNEQPVNGQGGYRHGHYGYNNASAVNTNTNANTMTQHDTKSYYTMNVVVSPFKGYGIYPNSHLYATQEDFITDNLSYF